MAASSSACGLGVKFILGVTLRSVKSKMVLTAWIETRYTQTFISSECNKVLNKWYFYSTPQQCQRMAIIRIIIWRNFILGNQFTNQKAVKL